jgi:predicted peroxiredoxin
MAKLLFMSLHGSADPTTAAFPFIMANGAVEAGHEATIVLANEAVVLMNGTVAANMQGVGWPPFSEILAKTIENKIPIFV